MGRISRALLVLAVIVFAFGCAQKSGTPVEEQPIDETGQEAAFNGGDNGPGSAMAKNVKASPEGKQIVSKAKSAIGTPYVYGGTKPGGFDCSGLVKWSYSHVGVTLPRTAREQSVVGEEIGKVEDMRAGDIVAFRHPKRGYHTGIYVGDGKFVHSPRKKSHVRINSLSDPYFRETLLGARRVNMAAGENLVAQAQDRLDQMIAEKTKLSVSHKNMRAMQQKRQAVAAKTGKNHRSTASVASKTARQKNGAAHKTAEKQKSAKQQNKSSKSKASAAQNKATADKRNAQKTGKSGAVAKNSAKSAKTVAQGQKKQPANAKKSSGKTVSMLQKKAHPVRNSKGKHS